MSDSVGKQSEFYNIKEYLKFRSTHLNSTDHKLILSKDLSQKDKLWSMCLLNESNLKKKLPIEWFDLGFRCEIKKSSEQCSSWFTAIYKTQINKGFKISYDLTGGLGIDSIALSSKAEKHFYFEKNKSLCQQAEYNFSALGIKNVEVINSKAESFLSKPRTDDTLVYLDPDRRGEYGQKMNSLDDMNPSWDLISKIHSEGWNLLVKLSPLQDLNDLFRRTNNEGTIHILEHHRECKEIVLEWPSFTLEPSKIIVHETEGKWPIQILRRDGIGIQPDHFGFDFKGIIADPSQAMIKSACWQEISNTFGIKKIAANTHLFHSEKVLNEFPGRQFEIIGKLDKKKIPKQASIVCKNYFLKPDELRKKLKMNESEEFFVFGFRDQFQKGHLLLSRRLI